MTANPIDEAVDLLEVARSTGLRSYLHGVNATDARELLVRFVAALTAAQQQGQAVGGWPLGELNRQETLKVLREHNAWRRGGDGTQTDPRLLGLALDAAIAAITATPPSAPVGVEGVRRYLAARDAKPIRGMDPDVIHAIHTGTEWEAELRMSDLRALAQQPAAVDGAMAERFCRRWYEITGRSLERVHVLASLDAALATQHQEPTT